MGGRTLPHLTFVRLTAEGFGVAWWHGLQVRAALGVAGRTHFLVGLAGVGGAEYLFCWPMAAVCLCLTWTLPCALPIGGRVVSTGGGPWGLQVLTPPLRIPWASVGPVRPVPGGAASTTWLSRVHPLQVVGRGSRWLLPPSPRVKGPSHVQPQILSEGYLHAPGWPPLGAFCPQGLRRETELQPGTPGLAVCPRALGLQSVLSVNWGTATACAPPVRLGARSGGLCRQGSEDHSHLGHSLVYLQRRQAR